jgi:hypothetical protein
MSPMIGHFRRLLRLPQKQPGLGRAVPSGSKEGEPDEAKNQYGKAGTDYQQRKH